MQCLVEFVSSDETFNNTNAPKNIPIIVPSSETKTPNENIVDAKSKEAAEDKSNPQNHVTEKIPSKRSQKKLRKRAREMAREVAQRGMGPEEEYQKDLETALIKSKRESLVNSEEQYRTDLNAALIESGGEPTLDFFLKKNKLTEKNSLMALDIALTESKKDPICLEIELLNCRSEIYKEVALKVSRFELAKNSEKIFISITKMDIAIWKYIITLITDLDLFSFSLVSKCFSNIIKDSGIELRSHIEWVNHPIIESRNQIEPDSTSEKYNYCMQRIIIIRNKVIIGYTRYDRLLFLAAIGQW
jgi:hypothetical protein